jgi:putative ABC transport system permease protein
MRRERLAAVTFLGLIVRNLLRQRVRAVLTLLGISLGITTVVALGTITSGLKQTASGFLRAAGSDFVVAQEGAADLSFSTIPVERLAPLVEVPGVADVRPLLLHITTAGGNPYFFLIGVEDPVLARHPPALVAGRLLAPGSSDEIVLGTRAAAGLGVAVGDRTTISGQTFTVVGTFRSEVVWEDGGGYAPLATVQTIAAKPATVSVASVYVAPGADPVAVAARIEADVAGLVTIATADEYGKVDQGFAILDGANAAISLLAVLLGGIGVMNTMVMSIFERTREIGVLRAVGWTGRRVLAMVVLESLLLCLLAAAVGSLAGIGASRLVLLLPAVEGFIVPAYPLSVFRQALLVGVGVGLAGAAYPALRAARLLPMEALRYE